MNNSLSELTVIVVTFKTDITLLRNCLNSIDSRVNVIIVENSKNFVNKNEIENQYKNVKILCSGSNLGYGAGNNFGLDRTTTRYALILNPDVVCRENYFKNIEKYIDNKADFSIIGAQYEDNEEWAPCGYFNSKKTIDFNPKKDPDLVKVDWVVGCSLLIDLNKFKSAKIFDENFFLYFEEFDLCKQIKNLSGNVFSSKSLIIDHLGFKGSFAYDKDYAIEALKIRNWHWMWSFFYYHKKNEGYFFALKKTFGKLIKSFFKSIYYFISFNKNERIRYSYRFLGLINSMTGKKSWFRINF